MSREIKVLHLESTDVCQAACPQCARETDTDFDKKQKHHLTVKVLERILPIDLISNLDKMFMCGNYGDPAAGKETLEIFRWFRKHNPDITLGMNTNGAIGNIAWWTSLAEILNQPRDYVVFSIDGLEDTNSIYRVNVNWQNLMINAKTFISAGGTAHWDMLVYRHNEHQIDQCEDLARSMGFRWFRSKVSKRPLIKNLEFPVSWEVHKKQHKSIKCHALEEQSIYVDAQGRISPCCWLGSRQKNFIKDFDLVQKSWDSDSPEITCVEACGSDSSKTNFLDQWKKQVQL